MKMKHLLLPLMAGMACYATTVTAREAPLAGKTKSSSLHFIENKGQITDQFLEHRKDIDFKLNGGNGLSIFIGNGKMHYQWSKSSASTTSRASRASAIEVNEATEDFEPVDNAVAEVLESVVIEALDNAVAEVLEAYRMDVELIGANPYARIITEGKQNFYERYFLSWVNKDNSNEGVIAHAFRKITYKDIYPDIDWVFYFNSKGQLEHDFVVHPGGKVSDIRIKYSGTDALEINPDGSLSATTPMGMVTENAPYAYTNQRAIQKREEISPLRSAPLHFGRDDGRASAVSVASRASATEATAVVASKFRLDDNILSFEVAPYSGTLVIDPVIEWGTYFGGTGDDAGLDITTDEWSNVYMCGSTNSIANIATVGAHQDTFAGAGNDAYLSKWDQGGNLLWATYYGGENIDVANGVACDTSGNVYIGGNSNSMEGIATTGSYQEVKAGNPVQNRHDAFIAKFDSSGARMWATYFGGSNNDAQTSFALTTDHTDYIYIAANAQSADIPVTSGVHQLTKAGSSSSNDAFIAKFNTAGNLVWSTYYGGENHDYPYGIDCDTNGNLYITGYTQSTTGIAIIGAHQVSHAGGQDAFLAKFDNSGRQVWGTYIGGDGTDQARAISVGDSIVTIGGITLSHSGIATTNGHQISIGGDQDGFISTFDLSGQQLWATYYGGSKEDNVKAIWCNSNGDIFVSGATLSIADIATAGSIKDTLTGDTDFFIGKFSQFGKREWSTYIGGSDLESEPRIAGFNSLIYLSGRTNSGNGISTNFSILSGGEDAFLIKINDCDKPGIPDTIEGNIEVCAGSTQYYSVNKNSAIIKYTWLLPIGWEGNSDSNSIAITFGNDDGMIRVVAVNDCGGISDTQSLEVTVLPLPEPEIINNNNILSTDQTYGSYQWIWDGEDIEGATSATHIATKDGDYTVQVTNEDGCEGLSEVEAVTGTVTIQHPDRNSAIEVYPNPAKDMVYVQSNISGFMHLYSINGRLVYQDITLNAGINNLDIDNLAEGIYQLQIITDRDVRVFKIVKTE